MHNIHTTKKKKKEIPIQDTDNIVHDEYWYEYDISPKIRFTPVESRGGGLGWRVMSRSYSGVWTHMGNY